MTAIIRELPSGRGFKLSYMYREKCEIINFYYSSPPSVPYEFAILRDDRINDPKNNLHRFLERIKVENCNTVEEARELALFRVYQHAKFYMEEHCHPSNQTLVDKTRFSQPCSKPRNHLQNIRYESILM